MLNLPFSIRINISTLYFEKILLLVAIHILRCAIEYSRQGQKFRTYFLKFKMFIVLNVLSGGLWPPIYHCNTFHLTFPIHDSFFFFLYSLFFLRSLAQFFTQIYINCLVNNLNKMGKFW